MRRSLLLGAVVAAVALSSCAADYPRYLLRATIEEGRILWRRQPIEEMLAGPLDDATRAKLELALAVRRFAADDLGLAVGGSYRALARVDQDQVVHVVSAAPRDRLEPYTWWFPIVGDVPYRGYFDRADADALARKLEAEGYDTYVRPSIAFSTLGWFDDPLLSNMLRFEPVPFAEVVIHELSHNTIYLSGQAPFNESFANFVGYRGAIDFFTSRGDTAAAEVARDRWKDMLEFSAFLGRELTRLQDAYSRGIDEARRQQLFDELRVHFAAQNWRTDQFNGFAEGPLNNAILVQRRVYAGDLALFERCWERFGGDLPRTIDWITQNARQGGDAFGAVRAALALPAAPAAE